MTSRLGAWWSSEDDATRGALVAIGLAAVVARVYALQQPMRYDESVTYLRFVSRPWAVALRSYQIPDNHLLYTLAAKLAVALGGNAPWVIRLPAFIVGLAIIPLTYAVGRALYSQTAALFGAAFAAAATQLILFSANARGYAFVVAAFLGLLLVGQRLKDGSALRRGWALFAVLAAAGMATVPVMLYPLGAVVGWLALTMVVERGRRSLGALGWLALAMLGAVVLTTVAYLPIIRANGLDALTANRFVIGEPWPRFYHGLFPRLVSTVAGWAEPYPWEAVMLLGVATAFGAVRWKRASRAAVSPLLVSVAWSAVLLAATHRLPFTRIWLWVLPLVGLAAGTAIELGLRTSRGSKLRPFVPALAGAVAVVGVAWGLSNGALGRNTDTGVFAAAQPVAEALATHLQPGDHIVAPIPVGATLRYYFLRLGVDTSYLAPADSATMREVIVLDDRYAQTVGSLVAQGMVDTAHFGPIAPALHARDGEVYVAERKGIAR